MLPVGVEMMIPGRRWERGREEGRTLRWEKCTYMFMCIHVHVYIHDKNMVRPTHVHVSLCVCVCVCVHVYAYEHSSTHRLPVLKS